MGMRTSFCAFVFALSILLSFGAKVDSAIPAAHVIDAKKSKRVCVIYVDVTNMLFCHEQIEA